MPLFQLSGSVTTSVAIYPNASDNWDIISPFPGVTLGMGVVAFVFSNSKINNDGSLHLLPDRLVDIGKSHNSVNFLTKTNIGQETTPESSGIGGMSKLKDINFGMLKDVMEARDIIDLYGRTVVIFLSASNAIEDITDPNKSEVVYKGKIYSAKRKKESISFIVRGLLNTADPLVGGAVVETSDGTQQNEAIVFGDSGDMFIPISKKFIGGEYKLQWSQSDQYIIKDLYVKGGSVKEPVFSKINTPYNIINNEIIFNTEEFTSATLRFSIPAQISKDIIVAKASYELAIHFTTDPTFILTPGDRALYKERSPTRQFPNKLIYKRTEIIDSENIYIFSCGWEFIYGYLRNRIDYPTGYVPQILFFAPVAMIDIDYVVTGENENPIEKEIDALPFTGTNWDGHELKTIIQTRLEDGVKLFQLISPEGLVIKIDDEEMLVTYTEKDSYEPTSEAVVDAPINTAICVVRGWNNTTETSHSIGTPIKVLNVDSKQKVIYTLEQKLQNITTVTPSPDWIFSDFDKFLNEEEPLVINSKAGLISGKHDNAGFIGLDFKLPDTPGDLLYASLFGEATCGFDTNQTFIPEDLDRSCFMNLALNVADDFLLSKKLMYRRAFGERVGSHDKQDKPYFTKFNTDSDLSIQGEYEFLLKTSWEFDIDVTTKLPQVLWAFYTIKKRTNIYDIPDYDELKKVSKFIVFNSSTMWKKRTWFNLTLPTLKVNMKASLEDVDIYAKVVPLSIFDNPSDTFAIGANCKIAWHPLGHSAGEKNILAISDDDTRCFGYIWISLLGKFDTNFSQFTVDPPFSNSAVVGTLVKNLEYYNDSGKLYPSTNKKEWYQSEGAGYKAGSFVRSDNLPDGLLDAGKFIVENDNCYIWVDQTSNLLKIALKQDTDVGNPVRIIKTILETYYDDVTLDTTAFNIAITKRADWNARLLVKDEKKLISLVDKIAKEHGLLVFENNIGEISIVALDPPAEDEITRDITDSEVRYKKSDVAFEEIFTDLDYLITVLDVYYDFIDGKYKGYIKSNDLVNQDFFTVSNQFVENPIKVKLQLQSVFEENTANYCAEIKMTYHQIPTRVLKIMTTLGTSDIEIGEWVSCSSTKITEVSGKIYLVTGKKEQIPFHGKDPHIELTLFEYDWDSLVLRIQEVPEQNIVDDYDEVISTIDDIDEVPDM